ncbi:hypothetical protein LEN26_005371 [Aphanomyces euteiches]|nr:hypothetical protein AeMF1_005791 [Aphanomyces euteiches]KAH9138258.1 hypothetical protein LEN26_005371 [Aphanomyces euteiches]
MEDERRGFTIEDARRNRISQESRVKTTLLKPCNESKDETTINLSVFSYNNFLEFIEWRIQNKPKITAGTLSGYRSSLKSLYKDQNVHLPDEYGDDLKLIFSGIKKSMATNMQVGHKDYTGKRPLTFMMFESLAYTSLKLNDSGFTHLISHHDLEFNVQVTVNGNDKI